MHDLVTKSLTNEEMRTVATKTKSAAAKPAAKSKTAPAKRAAAKSAPKSAPKAAAATKPTAKPKAAVKTAAKTSAKANPKASENANGAGAYPTSIADKKSWQSGSKINKRTGFTEGTISDKIALALLKGGKSRADIVNSLDDLPNETKKGTPLQRTNVAATVERQMRAMGFTVSQSYKMIPPKRA